MIPPSPFTPNQQQCFLADTYNYSQHRGSLPVIYDPNLLNQAAGIHVTAQAAAAAAAAAAMAQPPHVQMIDQNQYARRHTEGSLPLRSLGGVGSGRKHRANSTTGSNSAGNSRRNSKAASTISDGLGTEEEDEAKRKQFLERNRQAALKCRQRKKQWLANLQNRVEFLSADNEQLHSQATMLREEIINLKTLLLAHRDCKVAQANGTTVEMIQSVSSQSFNNIPLSSSTMISGAVTSNTSTPIFANTNLEMRGGPNLHPHQQLQQHQHHPQQ
ncbi:hypothetical protein BDF20DRAFT_855153 [Mycotypha africana]|uniref:uncharacterized protein n=1 Tax=Mycotypha africana TaxID=64632 RepID=UPI002300CC3B|nr:uncharacterized protein BDF20DRAFT_855153 [Mycotypha africana]KAI8988330.1 hypothetical protein BDF20DRAFT_855153 [Mycotypha africana]